MLRKTGRGPVFCFASFSSRPEVTKGPDFTHKRTNHEFRRPCESIGRVPQRGGESVTVFPGRSLGQHRASGLNLLVTAIILWNTRYLERAVAALRQTEDVPDQLLAHLSPLGWEHANLTGDYIWSAERPVMESRDGFRSLRAAPDAARKAA